ncbi:superoxide dismutase [Chryseobacterium lathyri]|uniref:Superoxide dismutase n=1 Tax=Chryseobacterium lathyri TaxID=395933 RepID=A0ABT9SJU2_9FLAO|nr:superoxide dismutase [Chryseobacterium lathyri]MDP9959247.1 Fe-Mn family superoxide dismutase [Chryseobacterium lathyri]MDQ0065199.1 Fe-Mn family superoxide dismutase [Chryseobacterium lathyri]
MSTFTLPQLPYAYDALEPFIDKETMTIHHQRHHQAYVDNLNAALKASEETSDDLDSILQRISEYSPAVRNNGGGHFNHSLFWEILSPQPQLSPEGKLAEAIKSTFGSLEDLKAEMKKLGLGQFGSGWVWLFVKFNGSLALSSTPNQDNPMMDIQPANRGLPILGIDVWEHAYYLAYQNKRADYLDSFWSVLNWSAVEKKYEEALSKIK